MDLKTTIFNKIDISVIALLFVIFSATIFSFHYSIWKKPNKVIENEVQSYYGYLPAAFIYNDISLSYIDTKEHKDLFVRYWKTKSEKGKYILTTSSGMAILYFPFFVVANQLAPILGYESDGYSLPYRFAISMSSLFYLAIGLFFLRKLLNRYFPRYITAITMIIIVICTNILYYVSHEPGMSHVYSFALITIFILLSDNWYNNPCIKNAILLGLLAGIISLIRPTNIVVILILILWKINNLTELWKRILFFINKWHFVLIMIFMALLVWIPQIIYWYTLSGSLFYYSYPEGETFFFSNPQMWSTIFSWRKGLFIYTPVLLLSVIGFINLYKQQRGLFWPFLIYLIITWYLISSWWSWWYGGSLGLRPFIDSYSVFAISLAAFIKWTFELKWKSKIGIIVILLGLSHLGYWHTKRYIGGSIHWVAMTKEAYFSCFNRKSPTAEFKSKLRYPDNKLAKQGIYKYKDDTNNKK